MWSNFARAVRVANSALSNFVELPLRDFLIAMGLLEASLSSAHRSHANDFGDAYRGTRTYMGSRVSCQCSNER